MIATTVPVTIDADAQERINHLGRRKEVEEMLDHAMRTIPALVRLDVTLPASYEHEDEMLVIDAYGPWDSDQLRRIGDDYFQWIIKIFPPEVYADFLFIPNPVISNETTPSP